MPLNVTLEYKEKLSSRFLYVLLEVITTPGIQIELTFFPMLVRPCVVSNKANMFCSGEEPS